MPVPFLQDLCHSWKDEFDWQAQVQQFSAFSQYRYLRNGFGIHFLLQRGHGPSPIPLIVTHGWPGSLLEMLKLIPLPPEPGRHGAADSDAFDVVVPSLPGFGFSDHPVPSGVNVFSIAAMWADLMAELGYPKFAAQGGDLGAGISTALGLHCPDRLFGIHLNYIPGSYRPYVPAGESLRPAENEFLRQSASWSEEHGAYAHVQRTRPRTLAYALNDSPVGLAAWMVEKYRDWSDCGGDVYRRFSRDEILTNLTLFWVTRTILSSFHLYYETRRTPHYETRRTPLHFGLGEYVACPCAVAHFPRELPLPPPEWVQRGYNLKRWTNFPQGGYFAAAEEPGLLAQDIRAFFRPFR